MLIGCNVQQLPYDYLSGLETKFLVKSFAAVKSVSCLSTSGTPTTKTINIKPLENDYMWLIYAETRQSSLYNSEKGQSHR
jgi:hypothetical protein